MGTSINTPAKQPLIKNLSRSLTARFLLAGGCATMIQYALLILFVEWFSLNAVLASIVAYTVSALTNYLMNYYITFSSQANHLAALGKFSVVASIGLTGNAAIMALGVDLLQLHYLPVQIVATLTILVWNFLAHKLWTYRSSPATQPGAKRPQAASSPHGDN